MADAMLDPQYPDALEWADAGARDHIPPAFGMQPVPVGRTLPSGSSQRDIQAAVDELAAQRADGQATPAAVLLSPGTYTLTEPLHLRSNVVLRGQNTDQVKFQILIRHTWNGRWRPEPVFPAGIAGHGVHHAGLEHLTICYDESIGRPPSLRHLEPTFDDNPHKDNPYYVTSVDFREATDCWLDGCRIINAGSSPLSFIRSNHCTAVNTEILGAHNKHGGMGYLNVSRSTHILLKSLLVRDIRHVSIQNAEPDFPCRYNVVCGCDLEVDVNYHNGDSGHNLVQDCRIRIPSWHWWPPFCHGVAGQHAPPGPANLIFRCDARRYWVGLRQRLHVAPDASRVYTMRSSYEEPEMIRDIGPAPLSGSLYLPDQTPR